ncbi:nucleotidyl transferase AbiEii/AbiGii toxin family protein [Nocardioides sp. URHA0020]|uniref:nucleotidyl transferase AbiEii/AbiGii toxin family protein n=1 Tax=Nocardioides sp. URHA0020 TaxID=1380392 RepID=UPI0006891529|nr:nucleotidyl transferase AbiEii/AbiGii toxin family protein [Nocardioides sp. URHA0020]
MAEVLSMLDAPLLAEHNCWFAGGAAIVLANGEYRESVDIEFLVSDQQSYRQLRQIVRDRGLNALATRNLEVGRTPPVDGYKIRTSVLVGGVAIKIEIIHEGRIDLDTPSSEDKICGVLTLTRTDQVASKLLANDDRWADTSTFSRDLIDLAMMRPDTAALKAGARKAFDAYGKTVGESLSSAISYLREHPHRLDQYIRALNIEAPRAAVWQSVRDLSARCARIEGLGPSIISTAGAHDDGDGSARDHQSRMVLPSA